MTQHGARSRPYAVRQRPSAASSRRWKLIGSAAVAQQRVVEALQAEPVAEAALLVGAELEQQHLAQQVGQLVGRRVGVAVDLGPGVGVLEAGVLDQEGDGLVDADLAAVHPDVEDDPAGPPDRVGVHVQPEVRARRRSPARASSARSTCPSPRRTRGRR